MVTETELKELLGEKYPYPKEDIEATTPVADITAGDINLGIYLNDKFGKQPGLSDQQNFLTFNDILKWLNS